MVNAVSMTKVEYVERKLAYATCTRTRKILPRDRDINLNEFSPGLEWTFFSHQGTTYSRINIKQPYRFKTACTRVSRAPSARRLAPAYTAART